MDMFHIKTSFLSSTSEATPLILVFPSLRSEDFDMHFSFRFFLLFLWDNVYSNLRVFQGVIEIVENKKDRRVKIMWTLVIVSFLKYLLKLGLSFAKYCPITFSHCAWRDHVSATKTRIMTRTYKYLNACKSWPWPQL